MGKTMLMSEELLDATGLLCPLPVLKLRKRLKAVPVGGVMRVLTDDPAAVIDVPHFCAESGHEVVEAETSGAVATWVIRKG